MYCLLLTDTDNGCIVRMATVVECQALRYDARIDYTDCSTLFGSLFYLIDNFADDDGVFSYTAQELLCGLQKRSSISN